MIVLDWMRREIVDLRRYVPSFLYRHDQENDTLLQTLIDEHEAVRLGELDVQKQLSPRTATWSLDNWEYMAGLETNRNIDYQTRRNRVLGTLMAVHMSTVAFMTNLINLYVADKSGKIIEHPEKYAIDLLIPDGKITSFENLEKALSINLPAHIGWKYIGYAHVTGEIFVGGIVSSYVHTKIEADTDIHMDVPKQVNTVVGIVNTAIITTIEADRYK